LREVQFSAFDPVGRMRAKLEWLSDDLVRLDEVEFHLATATQAMLGNESQRNRFLLGKVRPMVEHMLALPERDEIKRIFDVGIFKGGSAAFYAKLFEPEKLVAIDIAATPVEPLTEFIREHGFDGRVIPYYGVNQADEQAMGGILASNFPAQDIDLVVDDASHLYFETRTTFELAFPYLRPGGLYLIEDWAWAHWHGDEWQKSRFFPPMLPALSNLLIELFMVCASRPDIVKNLFVTHDTIVLRRGPTVLEPTRFEISKHYLCRDRWFRPVL
jgi:SAM-dependent methyltransferase